LEEWQTGQDDIGIAVVDGTQNLVGDKARHAVYQACPLPEDLLEGFRMFRLEVQTISYCDHDVRVLSKNATRSEYSNSIVPSYTDI